MIDRLLEQLRGVAIEQDVAADSIWDALAAEAVSSEEEAKLRAWAERSPEARAAYEVFQPSEEATLDALAEDALARLEEREEEFRLIQIPGDRKGSQTTDDPELGF